jgi:hypothetical protein
VPAEVGALSTLSSSEVIPLFFVGNFALALSPRGFQALRYRQDQPNEDRADPDESRGAPINHLDADYGDPVPTSRSPFGCSHRVFIEYVCHYPLTE